MSALRPTLFAILVMTAPLAVNAPVCAETADPALLSAPNDHARAAYLATEPGDEVTDVVARVSVTPARQREIIGVALASLVIGLIGIARLTLRRNR